MRRPLRQLRWLERDGGLLTHSTVLLRWPPFPLLPMSLTGIRGVPGATLISHIADRRQAWLRRPQEQVSIYSPTIKAFELIERIADELEAEGGRPWMMTKGGLAPPGEPPWLEIARQPGHPESPNPFFARCKAELPIFHEQLAAENVDFLTPRVYLVDGLLRFWFENRHLDSIRLVANVDVREPQAETFSNAAGGTSRSSSR